jgi:hypothetical protein
MDALQCFTFMSENVPSWITRISDLAEHTAKKHTEFSEEYKKLAHVRPRRRKNSSVHSIRPSSQFKGNTSRTPSRQDDDASSLQSAADGVQIFHSRHNVVIHYDGYTQKELEHVVRDIGTARNSIRKGKMSQLMRRPARVEMLAVKTTNKSLLRSMNDLGAAADADATTTRKGSSFDFVDKQLEIAQSFCEAAAHRFIRYGNCSADLENAKEKFELVLEVANTEAGRLRAEKEEQEHQEQEQQQKQRKKRSKTEEQTLALSENPVGVVEDGKILEPGAAAIEVDEDSASESSVSIDVTAFRANRFRH